MADTKRTDEQAAHEPKASPARIDDDQLDAVVGGLMPAGGAPATDPSVCISRT